MFNYERSAKEAIKFIGFPEARMKKIIITGPTGAIGHALIEKCLKEHCGVYAVCRPGSERIKSLLKYRNLHIIECDLSELTKAESLLPIDCDIFYHVGWAGSFGDNRNNINLQIKNVEYTIDAVHLAYKCGCNTFIGAGSQAEYGRVGGKLREDTPVFPENGYGMAKLCAGQMSRIEAHKLGLKHIWARILSVYGPYDGKYTMIMSTIEKLLKGEIPEFTKAEQQWDYLYSKDAAGILFSLAEKGTDGKIYCLGSGKVNKLCNYIKTIRDSINTNLQVEIGKIPYADKQVMYLCADVSDILNDLNYKYQYDFNKGIQETINWYKDYYIEK